MALCQGRVIVMNEIPDCADMILPFLRKRQGLAYQTANALAQRVVQMLDVIGLSARFPDRTVPFGWQRGGIRFPKIALRHSALTIDGRQRRPQLAGRGFIACANRDSHDFTGVAVERQPDPVFVPFVPDKGPHLVACDRQSAFFCAYPHFAGDVPIVLVDIELEPAFRDLDGPRDARQGDFFQQ